MLSADAQSDATCDALHQEPRAERYAKFAAEERCIFDPAAWFPSASDVQEWPADAQQVWLALLAATQAMFDDDGEPESGRFKVYARGRLEVLFNRSERRWGRAPVAIRRPLTRILAQAALSSRRSHGQGIPDSRTAWHGLTWPLSTVRVTSPSGDRQDPLNAHARGFHTGVDLAGTLGDPRVPICISRFGVARSFSIPSACSRNRYRSLASGRARSIPCAS